MKLKLPRVQEAFGRKQWHWTKRKRSPFLCSDVCDAKHQRITVLEKCVTIFQEVCLIYTYIVFLRYSLTMSKWTREYQYHIQCDRHLSLLKALFCDQEGRPVVSEYRRKQRQGKPWAFNVTPGNGCYFLWCSEGSTSATLAWQFPAVQGLFIKKTPGNISASEWKDWIRCYKKRQRVANGRLTERSRRDSPLTLRLRTLSHMIMFCQNICS